MLPAGQESRMGSLAKAAALFLGAFVFSFAGCQQYLHHHSRTSRIQPPNDASPGWFLAERAREALWHGEEDERNKRATAIDEYYESARLSWNALEQSNQVEPVLAIYENALAGMIRVGKAEQRLDPQKGLTLSSGRLVPLRYSGIAWQPGDVHKLVPPPKRGDRELIKYYQTDGIGLPMVGVHEQTANSFLNPESVFAITALLRPGPDGEFALEYCDPLIFDQVAVGQRALPMARDISAPWALAVKDLPQTWFRAFFTPSESDVQAQIHMIEPYQPGKIPLMLVHGLFSDPMTWVLLINELKNEPDIQRNYQIWSFRYPTGGRFFFSSSKFREQLIQLRMKLDPGRADPALDQMVMAGHSLGGIMAKIQVVESGNLLWDRIATGPFEALQGPPEVIRQAHNALFFHPVPSVRRIIFIGAPHNGAKLATGFLARSGERLITFDTPEDQQLKAFIAQNQNIIKPNMVTSIPTTLDMLEPNHPLLEALRLMPIAPWVKTHSIIGTGGWFGCRQETDGIVPVESAHHPGDVTELKVRGIHTHLHRNPDSIKEIKRILREHLRETKGPVH